MLPTDFQNYLQLYRQFVISQTYVFQVFAPSFWCPLDYLITMEDHKTRTIWALMFIYLLFICCFGENGNLIYHQKLWLDRLTSGERTEHHHRIDEKWSGGCKKPTVTVKQYKVLVATYIWKLSPESPGYCTFLKTFSPKMIIQIYIFIFRLEYHNKGRKPDMIYLDLIFFYISKTFNLNKNKKDYAWTCPSPAKFYFLNY